MSRLPQWTGDVARQALGNAVGTLIAALILFLSGVALGEIKDVPFSVIVVLVLVLFGLVLMAISAAIWVKKYPHYVEKKRLYDAMERPYERARQAASQLAEHESNHEEVEALIAAAKAAIKRDDAEEATRIAEEAYQRLGSTDFALDMANRYVDAMIEIAREKGIDVAPLEKGEASQRESSQA